MGLSMDRTENHSWCYRKAREISHKDGEMVQAVVSEMLFRKCSKKRVMRAQKGLQPEG